MAEISPFPGLHFDPARVPLEAVIAPPYDVISPSQQQELYARDPRNIVRLILNQETPEDDDTNNRYTRAATFLRDSLRDGVLVQDGTPALYETIQRFAHPLDSTRIVERTTLLTALKLEPYENGVVLPHEETHPKAKADRLDLMRATHANPEPIYGLYEDPEQHVSRALVAARQGQEPLLHTTFTGPSAPHGEEQIVYRHTDAALIADLTAFFASRRVWIADGHHRYETALNYQRERRQAADGSSTSALQSYDSLFIGLSAFEDPGLVVLPTHRLVKNLSTARLEDLPLQLERFFHLQTLPVEQARAWIHEQRPDEKRFVLLLADRGYALTLRGQELPEAAQEGTHCAAWQRLDVTILQVLVLDRSLGISWQALAHTPDVAYTRDEEEAVSKVQSGEYQLACLLQNPSVTEVRDVASAGDKMPQKSTFFYPKLYSGLIVRTLD
jgi:uncharacterized protein (DUF1015 family)